MTPEQWLSERTYHHSNFWDIRWLVEEKERQGLKISLCLPTYNEAKTIGKEIVLLKSALKDRYPLLDEIAVIDSGSTDDTREIAATFGADVYLAEEHLPEYGNHRGKGENLWKALYLLQGDIIVYVDSDINNIHPRFVYGLIGPLIKEPEVHYVKAFYDRPLAFSQGIRPTGGGRVTEILVRPLFSLFYPELATIIQPLSGEYAGRRSILEQIPFPVGYGVETAALIDIYEKLRPRRVCPNRSRHPRAPQSRDDRLGTDGLRDPAGVFQSADPRTAGPISRCAPRNHAAAQSPRRPLRASRIPHRRIRTPAHDGDRTIRPQIPPGTHRHGNLMIRKTNQREAERNHGWNTDGTRIKHGY